MSLKLLCLWLWIILWYHVCLTHILGIYDPSTYTHKFFLQGSLMTESKMLIKTNRIHRMKYDLRSNIVNMNNFHYNQRYTLKLNKNLNLARKCFCRVNHMQSAVIKLSFQPLTMNACLCMPKWFSIVFSSSVRLKKRHECTHQIQIVYIFSLFDYYRIFYFVKVLFHKIATVLLDLTYLIKLIEINC